MPVIYVLMKAGESWQLVRYWYGHVVLHSVQSPQYKVKDTDWISEFSGKLLNNDGKAAGTNSS